MRKRLQKNLNSDDHFNRSFLLIAMTATVQTKKQEITAVNFPNQKTNKKDIIMNTSSVPTSDRQITDQLGINKTGGTRLAAIFRCPLLLALLILPQMVQAQWAATVGAQTDEKGIQALAFLPNEIWIHAGDRITWTFQADENHTVTFLRAGQVRPDFNVGCPGFSSDPAIFDGSTCVTTPAMVTGQTFTVIFPVAAIL